MAENNNQNTVEKRQVEQLNSIPLEPVRDKVEFCHYSNAFVNTFAILLTFIWNFLAWKTDLFPIFTL